MARPVRFELTTPCSGGMYSIHLSYGRAVRAPSRIWKERATCKKPMSLRYSIPSDSLALAPILPAHQPAQTEEPDYPIARERIPFASFSISSAFFSMTTESTWTESVFSTSAFNSLANWKSRSIFFLMSF